MHAILERQARERLAAFKARKYPRSSRPPPDLKTISSHVSWHDTPSFRTVEGRDPVTLPGVAQMAPKRRLQRLGASSNSARGSVLDELEDNMDAGGSAAGANNPDDDLAERDTSRGRPSKHPRRDSAADFLHDSAVFLKSDHGLEFGMAKVRELLRDRKRRAEQKERLLKSLPVGVASAGAPRVASPAKAGGPAGAGDSAEAPAPAAAAAPLTEPMMQQVLFPSLRTAEASACDGLELGEAGEAAALLRKWGCGDSVPAAELGREALVGGWLAAHYEREGRCPAAVTQHLFKALAHSPDSSVACGALDALCSLAGSGQDPTLESPLYGAPLAAATFEWLPGDADFQAALHALGYRAGGKRLLRALVAICQHAERGGRGAALSAGGLGNLHMVLLRLRLDPAACILALDLEAAMLAVLGALDDSEWARQLPQLAAEAAAAGERPPATRLAAVRMLPTGSKRSALLQQHAAAALAASLLLSESASPRPPPRRAAAEALDVPTCFGALPWFASGTQAARDLGKAAAEGQTANERAAGVRELRAALAAADLLMWPFVLEHGTQHELVQCCGP
ncbi:hypothetical protein WJX81_003232 [Elliptochloris bilobata]|uniref:Uncharacterized protein n=1 Tax=Elliptochloris bilobata TaxID=381761 RepID=A0AAW1S8B5_9CHLO